MLSPQRYYENNLVTYKRIFQGRGSHVLDLYISAVPPKRDFSLNLLRCFDLNILITCLKHQM